MARILLLADSNFCNNIGSFKGRKIANLEYKSCQSRRAAMSEIGLFDEGILVVACLDIIAADVAKTTNTEVDNAVEVYYSQLLYKLIEKVDEADGKLAAGIVAPLFWTTHSTPVSRAMSHAFKLMKKSPLSSIWLTDFLKDVNVGADGVHLTSVSAGHYIQTILDLIQKINVESGIGPLQHVQVGPEQSSSRSWADDVPAQPDHEAVASLNPPDGANSLSPARTSSMVSLSMLSAGFSQSQAPRPAPVRAPTNVRLMRLANEPHVNFAIPPPGYNPVFQDVTTWRTPEVSTSLATIERRLGALEAKVFYDNIMMAGLKEEQDTEANKAMLNRVTIAGVPMELASTLTEQEKVQAIKDKANEIIDIIKQEGKQYKAVFVRHLNKQIRGATKAVLEVKFETEQQATDFRADFVKKQKDKDPNLPPKMNVAPVVRLATRVRVEILHSVANLLQMRDNSIVRSMCLQYIPKPVIKIVRRSLAGTEFVRTMTFIEAVCWVKVNDLCDVINLTRAYERAGSSFRGTLSQHFVLLSPSNSS